MKPSQPSVGESAASPGPPPLHRGRFWLTQAVGWGVFTAFGVVMVTQHRGAFASEDLQYFAVWNAGGLLMSSLVLAPLYLRVVERSRSTRTIFAAMGLGTVLGAALWVSLSTLAEHGLEIRSPSLLGAAPVGRVLLFVSGRSALTLALWSGIFLMFALARRVTWERERSARADAAAQRAQLALLQAQLNPHFLFNALNSVVALIDVEPARAQTLVRDLAQLLRRALRISRRPTATLGEELDFLELYVGCEQTRFEDRLQVTWKVEDRVRSCGVPPMILQPLVENAVRHGGDGGGGQVRIHIGCRGEGGRLVLEVRNTGSLQRHQHRDASEPGGHGIGLDNLRQRLAALYVDQHRFDLIQDGGWVRARLVLPTQYEARS